MQSKAKPNRTVARLRGQLRTAGIRQREVAVLAGVTTPHVCNVFAGRVVSRPVLNAARALLSARESQVPA